MRIHKPLLLKIIFAAGNAFENHFAAGKSGKWKFSENAFENAFENVQKSKNIQNVQKSGKWTPAHHAPISVCRRRRGAAGAAAPAAPTCERQCKQKNIHGNNNSE